MRKIEPVVCAGISAKRMEKKYARKGRGTDVKHQSLAQHPQVNSLVGKHFTLEKFDAGYREARRLPCRQLRLTTR